MSGDIFDRRLNGVAIYNPDLLSKDELVEQFIARQDLLAHFVADLRRPGFKQHQVIVGTRGMGKTTLLRRLRYAVEDDPKLDAFWMPVTFPEEQYNVARLSDLYLNFIDALGDALEQRGRRDEAEALDEAREGLPRGDEPRRAEAALVLLLDTAKRLDRRLLLLVDNLDLVLERLAKQPGEQWAFREMLSQKHAILLVGAMPVVIGATYDYDAPFYDFFQIHELGGLTRDETRRVLMRMAEQQGLPAVQTVLDTDPGRLDTLHTLTSGNPRTIALLFGVLAQGTDGDVRTDLERLLDQCTPLYKARFEALPTQAQQVVDAVAIHWDPISAGDLAGKLSVDVNTVSAQLNRLVQQGVLEKVEYDPSTRIGFQVAERFFNIWYLMRASRRVRRRLIWLVQFLRTFYGAAQLKAKVESVLRSAGIISTSEKLRHAEICLALAEVMSEDRKAQSALESTAIRTLISDQELSRQMVGLLDLDGIDASLRIVVDRERWAQQFNHAVDGLPIGESEKEEFRAIVGGVPYLTRAERLAIVPHWATLKRSDRDERLTVFRESHQTAVDVYGSRLASRIVHAVREGYMDTVEDEYGATSAALALDAPELEAPFADKYPDARDRLRRMLRMSDDPFIKATLAGVLARENDIVVSLTLIEEAIQQEAFAAADLVRGGILAKLGRSEDAIKSLSVGLKRIPAYRGGWYSLGSVLFELGQVSGSTDAYQKALDLRRDPATLVMVARGLLLMARYEEAAILLREALSTGSEEVSTTILLALALVSLDHTAEARDLVEAIRRRPVLSDDEVLSCALLLFGLGENIHAMDLVQTVLPGAFHSEGSQLPLFLQVLRMAAQQGYSSTIADLMEKFELHETMQPLYVALRIFGEKRRERLKRLAPETREAAEALLNEWGFAPVSGKTRKPARRKKKSA